MVASTMVMAFFESHLIISQLDCEISFFFFLLGVLDSASALVVALAIQVQFDRNSVRSLKNLASRELKTRE